jgi:glycosyltransferase involved in cell wall biosynthesis
MRVVINALGVPSIRQGGAGFYVAMLLDGLARSTDPVSLTTLVSPELAAELGSSSASASLLSADHRRERGRAAKLLGQVTARARPWRLDLGFGGLGCPAADVVHWPISFMHAPAPPRPARRVVTLHDLQHEHFPQFFSRSDLALRRVRWGGSARAADQLLTVSEFSKRSIERFCGIDPDRITVSHLPPRPSLLKALSSGSSCELPAELAGTRPWFVYPASPLPAKNHQRLVDAFATFRARHQPSARLVLTGPDLHSWAVVKRAIAEHGLEGDVFVLEHVADEMLASLYRQATGLVFPSLFEGFGLPIVEAMAAGCPMAFADSGSLPEVAGDVGRSFAAEDAEAIVAALRWLTDLDDDQRQAQAEAGRRRAASFTPEGMIESTMRAYRAALSRD